MRGLYRFLLITGFTFLLSPNAWALSCAMNGVFTSFNENDVPTHNIITNFEINQDGHSATFTGGLVKPFTFSDNSVGQDWVILPAGTTIEGVSSGEGAIKMDPAGDGLLISVEVGVDVNGRVQIIGEDSSVIREVLLTPGDAPDILSSRFDGDPLMSEIKIIIDGGSTETKIKFFSYDNSSLDDCGSGSSLNGSLFLLPIFIVFIRRLSNQK